MNSLLIGLAVLVGTALAFILPALLMWKVFGDKTYWESLRRFWNT